MSYWRPTIIIANHHVATRRHLIDLFNERFPSARVRVVYDVSHLLISPPRRIDAVFMDSSSPTGRIEAVRDRLPDVHVLLCDTPRYAQQGAPYVTPEVRMQSALPSLCELFPFVVPEALISLDGILMGKVSNGEAQRAESFYRARTVVTKSVARVH